MKLISYIFSIALIASLFSCEEEDASYPMATGTIIVDSAARVEATTGTLTLAFLTGKVTNSGNLPVERGLYISDTLGEISSDDPGVVARDADRTIADLDGGGGRFTLKVTLLKAQTMYYYRFYVKNYRGISLSPVESFYSAPTLPKLTIAPVVVTGDTAYFSGAVTSNGGESISQKGFVYSLGQLPVITDVDNVVILPQGDTLVSGFSDKVSGLLKNRKYYVRTYAVNRGGVNYSGQQIFTTNP
ncbi:MAG TPA: hypothetical protein PKY12_13165 [Catalimonadaceae bacterium]|nr:hypothetical protein [Catalimonadaceae bacterium]